MITKNRLSGRTMVRCLVSAVLLWSSIMHLLLLPGRTFAMNNEEDLWPDPPLPLAGPSDEEETRGFVSSTLGSNMVLQRNVESIIWGFTQPGSIVLTEFENNDYATEADDDGIWRQRLPAHPASLTPTTISVLSPTTGESAVLSNILFGDVYLCGGQSNMEFSIPGTTNGTVEAEIANRYPHIRLFTVGKGTSSPGKPLWDLQTVQEPWDVANATSIWHPDERKQFGYFSSVCWFFGRTVADGLNNEVPIGLISNNWGGTRVELWSPSTAFSKCHRRNEAQGALYNAMIHPYTVGPMSLTGFAWYQGESNTADQSSADAYACLFPAMIEAWREAFHRPHSYFGFVQLSTWCPRDNAVGVPELRRAQMEALKLPPAVGYATNADYGAGCNIHPPRKQFCGMRLGRSALALVYNKPIYWRSPSYDTSQIVEKDNKVIVSIFLKDVSGRGLKMIPRPYNQPFDCTNRSPGTCAWASIHLGNGWVNATISVQRTEMILTAEIKSNNQNKASSEPPGEVLGTAYGWGAVPMLNVYDAGTNLPVLPWNHSYTVSKPRFYSYLS